MNHNKKIMNQNKKNEEKDRRAKRKRLIASVIAIMGILCMVVPMAVSPLMTDYGMPAEHSHFEQDYEELQNEMFATSSIIPENTK